MKFKVYALLLSLSLLIVGSIQAAAASKMVEPTYKQAMQNAGYFLPYEKFYKNKQLTCDCINREYMWQLAFYASCEHDQDIKRLPTTGPGYMFKLVDAFKETHAKGCPRPNAVQRAALVNAAREKAEKVTKNNKLQELWKSRNITGYVPEITEIAMPSVPANTVIVEQKPAHQQLTITVTAPSTHLPTSAATATTSTAPATNATTAVPISIPVQPSSMGFATTSTSAALLERTEKVAMPTMASSTNSVGNLTSAAAIQDLERQQNIELTETMMPGIRKALEDPAVAQAYELGLQAAKDLNGRYTFAKVMIDAATKLAIDEAAALNSLGNEFSDQQQAMREMQKAIGEIKRTIDAIDRSNQDSNVLVDTCVKNLYKVIKQPYQTVKAKDTKEANDIANIVSQFNAMEALYDAIPADGSIISADNAIALGRKMCVQSQNIIMCVQAQNIWQESSNAPISAVPVTNAITVPASIPAQPSIATTSTTAALLQQIQKPPVPAIMPIAANSQDKSGLFTIGSAVITDPGFIKFLTNPWVQQAVKLANDAEKNRYGFAKATIDSWRAMAELPEVQNGISSSFLPTIKNIQQTIDGIDRAKSDSNLLVDSVFNDFCTALITESKELAPAADGFRAAYNLLPINSRDYTSEVEAKLGVINKEFISRHMPSLSTVPVTAITSTLPANSNATVVPALMSVQPSSNSSTVAPAANTTTSISSVRPTPPATPTKTFWLTPSRALFATALLGIGGAAAYKRKELAPLAKKALTVVQDKCVLQ